MTTHPIDFSQLRATNPSLYQALEQLDQSAERAAGLQATPGVFTEADLASANKVSPGSTALITASVGNATAANLANALDTVREASQGVHREPEPIHRPPFRPQPHEIADVDRVITDALRRASYADAHDNSYNNDARAVLRNCHRALLGSPGYTAEHARRLASAQDDYDNSYDADARAIITEWVNSDPFRGIDPNRDVQIASSMSRAADGYDNSYNESARAVIKTYHRAWVGRPEYTHQQARTLASLQDGYDNSYDADARAIITEWVNQDPFKGQDPNRDVNVAFRMASAADDYDNSYNASARAVMLSYHTAMLRHPGYTFDHAVRMSERTDDYDNSYDADAKRILREFNARSPACCG